MQDAGRSIQSNMGFKEILTCGAWDQTCVYLLSPLSHNQLDVYEEAKLTSPTFHYPTDKRVFFFFSPRAGIIVINPSTCKML